MCTYTHTHTHWNTTRPQKKNEILPFAKTWVDLEDIMLSEIIQTKKGKYCMIRFICII